MYMCIHMSVVTTKTTDTLIESDTYIEHSCRTIISALEITFCLHLLSAVRLQKLPEHHTPQHTYGSRTCATRPLLLSHYFMMYVYVYTYMYICISV